MDDIAKQLINNHEFDPVIKGALIMSEEDCILLMKKYNEKLILKEKKLEADIALMKKYNFETTLKVKKLEGDIDIFKDPYTIAILRKTTSNIAWKKIIDGQMHIKE